MSGFNIAESAKHDVRISNEEWMDISRGLEPYHGVFYQVWQMGRPIFDESIDTACVQFDQQGNFIWFRFNPVFWSSLDFKNKLFVISHEAMHIILNHGSRAKDVGTNGVAANVAMDIVINHTLTTSFGFERGDLVKEVACWVDTIFPDRDPIPPDDECFEYYYSLFERVYGDGGMGDGDCSPSTLDDHDGFTKSNFKNIIDELNNKLTPEEKQSLKTTIQKHFKEEENKDQAGSPSGTGGWVFAKTNIIKKKKKWETVIKKWTKKFLRNDEFEIQQWTRTNRRMAILPKDLILPSDVEMDDFHIDRSRVDVFFFLDTSGSCWDLKDRFFAAAETLPETRFNVRLFCFDTNVEETTLASRKIYGGGGTSFRIIESHIQKLISTNGCKYPEVFIITDGWGDVVKPKFPQKWHWFLTDNGSNNYLPKESNIYNLKDYE